MRRLPPSFDVDAKTMRLKTKMPTPRESTRELLEASDTNPTLTLGDVLGEGGMGIVRSAIQPSMRRVVAVKTLKGEATEHDALMMLREAWVTGYLEHPSIVPIHEITFAENGSPLVVMRRIEGKLWHDCLRDESWATASGSRDLLEHNLEVLLQVCQALVFAHDRGVLHRDIKPANVMLGPFGEIFLLDWGIALALSGEPTKFLPLAKDTHDPAGTVPYMAPEMAAIIDEGLSEQSDIYMLGAVLYEIATTAPPHGTDLGNAIESIAASPPRVPPSVAPELAAICTRAMQFQPSDRYASVSDFRDDVRRFLMHRDSLYVVAAGQALLRDLRTAVDANSPRRVLYDLWGECRFAFREALRTWPENRDASDGLRMAATILAEHELHRDPRVAAAILDEIAEPPSLLRSRIQAAVAEDDQKREKNARVAEDMDSAVGWRLRMGILVGLGIVWTTSALIGDRIGAQTHLRFVIGSALPIPFIVIAWLTSRELRRTLFNRRMFAALMCLFCSHAALFAACWGLGVDLSAARTLQTGIALLVAVTTAVGVDPRLWPMTIGLFVATVSSVVWPASRSIATGLGYLGVTINFAFVWLRHQRKGD